MLIVFQLLKAAIYLQLKKVKIVVIYEEEKSVL